jgi:phosphohistidine phosphatase SixA
MSLRQLNRSGRGTQHRRLSLALCAALLTGIAACAKVGSAEAAASSGVYSDSPAATPVIQREGASMIAHPEVLDSVDLRSLVAGMKQGGYVIVLRHGATNANQADTDPLHLDNIASQRLLSAEGREVATRVGDSFRKLGIPLGKVYSSEFNRATETAKLVSGKSVMTTPDLTEGGLVVSPAENARRAKALKAMAIAAPAPGVNTLIVTHKPNILDAFGKDWFDSKEGEASVFKPDGSNNLILVARVQAADWIKAADGF